MNALLMRQRMARCGATLPEIADLLGVHPRHLDDGSLSRLPELTTRALVELARLLDLHPADLVPGLEPVLSHTRQDAEPVQQDPEVEADARTVLAALVHAGTPLHTHTLCQALDWPQDRLRAALDHLQDHPRAAGPLALRRTGAHTYALGTRMDVLTGKQRAALEGAAGRVRPIGAQEAAVLAALAGFGPAPRGAAWSAGAESLAAAGLAAVTVEGEFAVDPAVRFSLFPEHSPSAQEEPEEEY